MFRKIWAISWVDIYNTFNDTSAIVITIIIPLVISLVFGGAFGSGDSDISIQQADVAVINYDDDTFGNLYACILVQDLPDEQAENCASNIESGDEESASEDDQSLEAFISGTLVTDEDQALEDLENGELDVVIIIPENFTSQVLERQQTSLALHYNAGGGVPTDIARIIIDGITAKINTGAIASTIIPDYATDAFPEEDIDMPYFVGLVQALSFNQSIQDKIAIEHENVDGNDTEFSALQFFAPSMAIFFMTFGMAAGAQSVLEDRREWTMQRIFTTPTPQWVYMAGKTIGTFVFGLFQMFALVIATSAVSTFIFGNDIAIWGSDIPAIILLVLSVVFAATGLGMIIASLGKNTEQVQSMTTLVLVVMGVISGSFVSVSNVPVVSQLRFLTLNHWGLNGFIELSAENGTLGDVMQNIIILLVMGIVFLSISLSIFSRRLRY